MRTNDKISRLKTLIGENPEVILEIGACDFSDTGKFLKTFPSARVYCFEPNPDMQAVFENKIGLQEKRCRFFNCAVGDSDGVTVLRSAYFRTGSGVKPWPYANSIVPGVESEQYPGLFFEGEKTVPVVRLDTWIKREGVTHVDFLWTDVQGSERKLIEGASETLRITRYVQLEFGEVGPYPGDALGREETIALMREHGFLPESDYSDGGKHRGDLLFRNPRW
ncbi:MAG: FkbM family methyltransferase [Candidatus Omnitrophota bacterium]